jgi:hypothetical protein
MHLQDESRRKPSFAEARTESNHRHLDDVGRSSLDRMIDRRSLSCGAKRGIRCAEFWDRPAATELRCHRPVSARLLFNRVDIPLDARVPLKVSRDK